MMTINHITNYLKDRGFMVRSDWNRMDDCYDFMISRRSICAVGKFKRGASISGFVDDLIQQWTREYICVYGKRPDELPGHIYNRCVPERTTPTIKNVIFNNPATIVFWSDGTKTVVKCQEDDIYDPEKGLAMAISKKFFGNKGNYCNEIKKWMDKYIEKMADEINPFEFAWTSIQKSIMNACDKINSSKATETQPVTTDAPKKQKILATMEFEVDISNLDPEYTNVMEQAKNIARNRLRDLMLKKEINADNFNYKIVKKDIGTDYISKISPADG